MAEASFRFNTRQLGESVRRHLQTQSARTRNTMDLVGGFLNGEVKDLTPQDQGFLTQDVSNKTVEYKESFAAVVYIPINAKSAQYAIPMHENYYKLGKNSLDKQRKLGKTVGRKFITRAIDGNMEDIKQMIIRRMKL